MLQSQSDGAQTSSQDARSRSTRHRGRAMELRFQHISQIVPVSEGVFDELLQMFRLQLL